MKIFNKIKKIVDSFAKDPLFLKRWEDITPYSRRRNKNQLHKNIYHGYSHEAFLVQSDTRMLIEDISNEIMPYFYLDKFIRDTESPRFYFSSDKIDPAIERIIISGISESSYRINLSEACTNFINRTVKQLICYGAVHYELIYELDDKGNLKSFEFEDIPNGYLFKFFGNYYQVIPWWVARKVQERVGVIKIPATKVLRIKLPNHLGDEKDVHSLLSRIHKISKESIPSFTIKLMQEGEQRVFDLKEWSKNQYIEIAALTKRFGWNQRTTKNITEYYFFERYLNSIEMYISIRKKIIDELNNFLKLSIIGFNEEILAKGFVTQEEVSNWRKRLNQGDLKFTEIFENLKNR